MTDSEISKSSPRGLVPPRPNLGPEPWSEPSWLSSTLGPILIILLALGALAWYWRNRRRRQPNLNRPAIVPSLPEDLPPTPLDRMIEISETVRSAMVEAHGPSWGSRTTEELAGESTLKDLIGIESARRLVEFFQISDRAKFAGEQPEKIDEWEKWANQLVRSLAAGTNIEGLRK